MSLIQGWKAQGRLLGSSPEVPEPILRLLVMSEGSRLKQALSLSHAQEFSALGAADRQRMIAGALAIRGEDKLCLSRLQPLELLTV